MDQTASASSLDSPEDSGLACSQEQGPRLFPSDEFIRFSQHLARLKTGNYPVAVLLGCLQEAENILCHTGRQTDIDALRRFLREDLQSAMDKLIANTGSRNAALEDTIYESLVYVVGVAAEMLHRRTQQSPDVLAEFDPDLLPLMHVMLGVLSMHRPLHASRQYEAAPLQLLQRCETFFEAIPNSIIWVPQQYAESAGQQQDDDMLDTDIQDENLVEINSWYTTLANTFGQLDGYSTIIEMLRNPAQVNFALMNTWLAILAQVVPDTSNEAKEQFKQVLQPVTAHLQELVMSDSDRLSDYGTDRTYTIFNCLININLQRLVTHACSAAEITAWRRQLHEILCTFVSKMLDSSSFNKLLSGARECNRMLHKAIKEPNGEHVLQDVFTWMHEQNIVQRLLRTGLHHKQYMNEVKGVMVKLTERLQLTTDHLDLMWAVTEKEDAYDAVKTHMFDLLAAVASECQPSQLDMLFAKLERRQAHSGQDTEQLLALLESLADSDNECKMEDKIIGLVWELTITANAPPQLLDLHTMEHVMQSYAADTKTIEDATACFNLINKCFLALQSGEGGIVPLLRTIRDLFKLLPSESKHKDFLTKERVIDSLDSQHGVIAHLVDTVCSRVSTVQEKVSSACAAAAEGKGDVDAADLAVIKATAAAELDDGIWSHADVVKELMLTLKYMATHNVSYCAEGLPERLWDTLMVNSVCGEGQAAASQAFFRAGFVGSPNSTPYFENTTQRALLQHHMVKQDVQGMPLSLAKLTWDVFEQVNGDKDVAALTAQQTPKGYYWYEARDLQKIIGLHLIWRIYLCNNDEGVAEHLRHHLQLLYHASSMQNEAPFFRRALVKQLVVHLQEADGELGASDQATAELAARKVARCLALANATVNAVEGSTMPPEPAHIRSWRGSPVLLEVQREGAARVRITSHDNEYIGLLRQRLAGHMACNAKNVRMFSMGHELIQDSVTVAGAGLRNRASINAMESPEPNKFTKAPSEHKERYALTSMVSLFSQTAGLYPLLLKVIDISSGGEDIASMALDLLAVLPTYHQLTEQLSAALEGPSKGEQLLEAVCAWAPSKDGGSAKQRAILPYRTLYAVQALCQLLFPTFEEAVLASLEREAKADGSACPSPASAAAVGGAAAGLALSSGAPSSTVDSMVVQALSQQQHRETLQQDFLQCGGLQTAVRAAQLAGAQGASDLRLQQQLAELLVTLHRNLLDAAVSWQPVPSGAVVVAGSNEPCAMSGAESGAGRPDQGARTPAAAHSQVGSLVAVGLEERGMVAAEVLQSAGEPAGSSTPAGDSHYAEPLGSKAAATTSDTACHHPPSSPAMEVSSPMPGQQQQGPKQRQRGSDLPPLPPQSQQQQVAGNGCSPLAAASGVSLLEQFSMQSLILMADSLLEVAVNTSQLWNRSDVLAADDESSRDSAVAREALLLLQRLLEQHQPLMQRLLLDAEQTPLISQVLLSPFYGSLRRQAGELLEKLVSIDSYRQRLLPWLLSRLAAARPLAQQHPTSCAEFYKLLSSMLAHLGQSWALLPEQLYATASSMLDEEVAALQAMAASGPVQSPLSPRTKQQRRRRRRRQVQASSTPVGDANEADEQQATGTCLLLQGRLHLVLALVQVLDRRAVGSDGQGGLMRLLLQDFLFPEAVAKVAAASGQLNLERCTSSLEPHCATSNSRRAALELLAELMGDSPASLEEGVSMLLRLHYQRQVLYKLGLQPRPLRLQGQHAGLKNGGATCYMNAVFQQLFMQPGIRSRVLGSAEVPEDEKDDSVFAQLQGLFAQLALSKFTYAAPYKFWAAFKDYDGTPIDVREHQDAYEFFTRLQDCIDQHLISNHQQPAIKPVMGGTFVQQIICRDHDFTSERNEDFYQISVEVKGMGTLQKSLDDYVKGELLEGDNAYLCEELGKRVPAVKRTAIKSLPQMLCVHLKRFEFDYHNQTRHKLRDRFEFPFELDMFPYTAEGLASADQQQKAAEEQQQAAAGTSRQVRPSSSSGATAAGSSGATATPGYVYDLHGVVVHSGSAFTGHYYSFIKERSSSSSSGTKDGEPEPRWFCFDDKDVALWDEGNLEVDCFGGKASQDSDMRGARPQRNEYERAHSAYMLFYERRAVGPDSSAAQQQDAGIADVDMAGDSSQHAHEQTPQHAAPATAPDQLQGQGQGDFLIPYNMPACLFKEITEANITFKWQLHVLDKHYFKFIRQLVDSRGDLGQLSTRKARRRDGAAVGVGSAGLALAAVPCNSGDRANSSMVCEPPINQQQMQPPPSPSGILPMQVSPSPGPAASAPQVGDACLTPVPAAAAGSAYSAPAGTSGPPPLQVPGSSLQQLPPGEPQQSPGPSSRRGEEADAVAQVLMRLGVMFQFEVYLYAHESLRSEAEVWTEALRSLMGSGSSSTACMQIFLELVHSHPQWLVAFLSAPQQQNQNCPRSWVSSMLSWTLQAASKRCAHQLQSYVATCLQRRLVVGPETAGQQAQEHALRQSMLSPLGQAMLGVVEQLVMLVRSSLPTCNQAGQPIGSRNIPVEPARVLLVYAESSPWAAAHLLQVFGIVPDLVDHITAAVLDSTEDLVCDDCTSLIELLDELLIYAANLPELTCEHSNTSQQVHNPYLRRLPGSSGSPGSNTSSDSGDAGGAGNSAGNTAATTPRATLTQSAYCKLVRGELMTALTQPLMLLESRRALHLAALLSFSSLESVKTWATHACSSISSWLTNVSPDNFSDPKWEEVCVKLSLVVLQPDQYLQHRVLYWLFGVYSTQGHQVLTARDNGLLAYQNAVSWHGLAAVKVLAAVLHHFSEQQHSSHRAQRIYDALSSSLTYCQQQLLSDVQAIVLCCRRNVGEGIPTMPVLQEVQAELLHALQRGQMLQRLAMDVSAPAQQQVQSQHQAAAEQEAPQQGHGTHQYDEDQEDDPDDIGADEGPV